ncbi:MAG: hypothetical protein LBJ11_08835 [Oscillospiraceae bacterium]|jgi:putative flippase GtrA|nr:hypothetical protein [Oscillospiraceae bacterium]
MSSATNEPQPFLDRLDNHPFAKKHAELWKFLKFLCAGLIASGPDLGTQMLFLYLFRAWNVTKLPHFFFFDLLARTLPPRDGFSLATVVYSFMISTCVGYTISFILNRKVAFHADSNVALSTFYYVLLVIFTIAATSLIGPTLEGAVGKITFLPTVMVQILSKIISMGIPNLWVYPVNRFIIHRKKKESVSAAVA